MTELRILRVVPASPERVWRAFTDPAALAAWFWPERWQTTAEVELMAGGRYRIASPISGMAVSGEYTVVDEPTKLAFSWRWDGEGGTSSVTIELAPVDAGTGITVTHERFADVDTRDQHVQGWNDCLDRLPRYLEAQPS
ncbi:MAG TPA: SRPBCC domain-containing protein [Rhodoglobus sp.]|nr:SRPBCC domain-containing protein [Rhodoglobus sp.]